ncbi:hypothetical protein CJF31_00001664 [Rutstroemia sp. NJR-2017a BVV2]|nr:hypothetical protein CJF31_00001664 [Rutstroemia sp. NJR-2017a BVV2]
MTKTLPFPLPLVRSSKKKKYIWNDNNNSIATAPASVLDLNMVEFTNNVEQLIRETDEAFQAVGFALGDAKAATRGWQQYDTRQSRTIGSKPMNIAVARTNPISKRDLMKTSQESPPSSGSLGKSPVPKSIVASKTKRTNSPKQKKHNSSPKSHRRTLPHPHTSARWHLGDVTASMADVFSGKMFSKIEVDEMLTPDRRQQLEEKAKKLDSERKASIGSALSEAARNSESSRAADGASPVDKSHELDGNQIFEADTTSPTEPFHLENLLPQIDISNDERTPTSAEPVSALSAPSDSMENIQQSSRKPLPDLPDSDDLEVSAIEQAFEDLNFPSPPRNSSPHLPRSRSNTGLTTTLLPTIPEVTQLQVKTLHTPTRSLSQDSEFSQDSATSSISDYIQLPSTPYTLTSPLFRHGPIRVETLCHSRRDSLNSPEEALDWTAFQMAISGTMDDGGFGFGADEESLQEADDAEVDALLEWWASFGYQGTGRLVKEAPPSRRKKARSDGSKEVSNLSKVVNFRTSKALGPSMMNTEVNATGTGLDYRGGLWVPQLRDQEFTSNNTPSRQSVQLKPKPAKTPTQSHFPRSRAITPPPAPLPSQQQQQQQQQPPQGPGARRDVVLKVDVPPTNTADDSDDDSLPPSPINLVKIKDEYIPMGYNLGHDLGDFLNWETYHVQSLFGEDEGRGYM